MLAAAQRLRRRGEFAAAVRGGRRAARGALVVHVKFPDPENSDRPARAGFVVPRTIGGAVVRNQVKRRLRQLVETHRIREAGEISFHYVRRSGKIGRLDVSLQTQKDLEQGEAAVVEDPGSPDCAVVPGEAAKRIYEVDPQAIRFWYGPEKPIGFSDAGE